MVPVRQQVCQERVLGLDVQVRQRLRVGGVPGLRLPGLRHLQVGEQHLLQLLRGGQVHLPADHLVRLLRCGPDLGVEVLLQLTEVADIGGDPGLLHPRQHCGHRELQVGEQVGGVPLRELLPQRPVQLQDGSSTDRTELGLPRSVQHEHLLGAAVRLGAQLPADETHRQVREVVGALVRMAQVGGHRRVEDDAVQHQPAPVQGVPGVLRLVQHLRGLRVGEPGGQSGLVLRGDLSQVDAEHRPTLGSQRQRPRVPAALGGGAGHVQPDLGGGVRIQPGLRLPSGQCGDVQVEGGGVSSLGVLRVHREQPLTQHPELQGVEHLVHPLPLVRAAGQVLQGDGQLHVGDQLVQLPVEQHLVEVLPQRGTRLAGDRGGIGDDALQPAVRVDPLGSGLRADSGHPGQVVAALPHQCGQVAVLLRTHAVLVRDRLRGHPAQLGDPLARVEHGDDVVDELEGVPVPGADEHIEPVPATGGGQGGEDVVGLEAFFAQCGDAQGCEHLFDQRDLATELLRSLVAGALVVGIGLLPERLAGDVEGDRHVRGVLVPQQVDQHRGEPVDRVRGLPGGGGEVLCRKREERTVGHRVAVDDQEPGSRSVGHR